MIFKEINKNTGKMPGRREKFWAQCRVNTGLSSKKKNAARKHWVKGNTTIKMLWWRVRCISKDVEAIRGILLINGANSLCNKGKIIEPVETNRSVRGGKNVEF
jgi:hypothetical protein